MDSVPVMSSANARLRHLLAASGVCAALLTTGGTTAAFAAPSTGADSTSYFGIVNNERSSHGLSPLTMRGDLVGVAQGWAAHMASTNQLMHNPRLRSAVANWQAVGENVGEGSTIGDLAAAFMASPSHRDNILDPTYQDIGIGSVRRLGTIWIAVVFRDPLGSQRTTSPPPSPAHASTGSGSPGPVAQVTPGRNLLRSGSVGADVARLQRQLHVKADGLFGPVTNRAVMAFQRRHHLSVDGIVGPLTRAALRQARHDAPRRVAMQRATMHRGTMLRRTMLRLDEVWQPRPVPIHF
jgi:uncharacterized protein YkwD